MAQDVADSPREMGPDGIAKDASHRINTSNGVNTQKKTMKEKIRHGLGWEIQLWDYNGNKYADLGFSIPTKKTLNSRYFA